MSFEFDEIKLGPMKSNLGHAGKSFEVEAIGLRVTITVEFRVTKLGPGLDFCAIEPRGVLEFGAARNVTARRCAVSEHSMECSFLQRICQYRTGGQRC